MPAFLIYEGKVAAALAVFYLFYRLLLRKETFHRLNRLVLVGTTVLSFVLPLCIITFHRPMAEAEAPTEVPFLAEAPAMDLVPAMEASAPWWPVALAAIFWTGVALVLARAAVSLLSIWIIVKQGTPVREEEGGKIIVTERDIDPFSWMKFIVLSRQDWEGDRTPIIAHEKAHIAYGHSTELLLVDVLSAFQWFNPVIWMLRADLQEIHEYEADKAVLRAGTNIKEYQYLLIRKAVSKSGYSVANSFNHSILKNRITMMSKSKSPLSRGLRVLWLLPLVCLGIGLQARTVYVPVDKDSEKIDQDEKKKGVLEEIVVVAYADDSVTPEQIKHGETLTAFPAATNRKVDTPPVFSEGNFSAWLNRRLVFPKGCLYEGTVVTCFTVNEKGQVEGIKVLRSVCEELDNTVVSLVKQSPAWTPATLGGKAVGFQLVIPVTFKIRTSQVAATQPITITLHIKADGKIENGGKVYTLAQIKDIVPAHESGQPQNTVIISAADNVPMGVIDDVKEELRKLESLKIRYVAEGGQEGMTRYLPPVPGNKTVKVQEAIPQGADRENYFVVRINSADRFFFGNKPGQDDAEMQQVAKDFLKAHGNRTRFTLMADRGASYGAYRHIQELLLNVYADVRNEKAVAQYGKSYSELTAEEKSDINFQVPYSISESLKEKP